MKVSYPKLHSIKWKGHENVKILPGLTSLKIDPQRVLIAALNERLDEVIVLGTCRDGEPYIATSMANESDVIYACERAKHKLMQIIDG